MPATCVPCAHASMVPYGDIVKSTSPITLPRRSGCPGRPSSDPATYPDASSKMPQSRMAMTTELEPCVVLQAVGAWIFVMFHWVTPVFVHADGLLTKHGSFGVSLKVTA